MNILAVGAHPDDIEMGCGGTLAKCSSRGDKIFMCHIGTGNVGYKVIQPEELVEIRRIEAWAAGELIGAEVLEIGVNDLFIRSENIETRDKLVDMIRYTKPGFMIMHNPKDYMDDHDETSKLVFEAAMAATVHHH